MNREILFRAKHIHIIPGNEHLNGTWAHGYLSDKDYIYDKSLEGEFLVDENTICQYTGLHDKNGKRIWENDILMCHDNPKDLVKAVFGEFNVIEVESEEVIDSVIGWHYEVIPTDELSKCEPFCYSMPLTDTYIKLNEMEVAGNVFDNPELLEEENVHGTDQARRKMTRQEKEDQAQLEWLQKWKERRKEKRNVRKKPLFYKILRKLGIIKDYEEDIRTRMEMCERAIKANVCPEDCDICAWDVKGGIDYNGYITTDRNNRKPSEVSKKNQRTDKKKGSSQVKH